MDSNFNSDLFLLFQDFYNVTGIYSGIWDLSYTPIKGARVSGVDLCTFFHKNPKVCEGCVNCDKSASKKVLSTQKGFLYRCHMGLWEYIAPVYKDNAIIGFASTGMMSDGTDEEYSLLMDSVKRYGMNEKEFEIYYSKEQKRSIEQIRSICTLFESCVSHIYRENLIQLEDVGCFQNIESYISSHLSEPIDVNSLAKEFKMSRSELYRLFGKYRDAGIAEYIKIKRLKTAASLLRSTKHSITKIADMVGYNNYSYFSKIFHERYGLTPHKYRSSI